VNVAAEYLQLKAKYKTMWTLGGLSRFSWDEGEQMVTTPLQVWESYIQVIQVSSCVSFLLTISYAQSLNKAKKIHD